MPSEPSSLFKQMRSATGALRKTADRLKDVAAASDAGMLVAGLTAGQLGPGDVSRAADAASRRRINFLSAYLRDPQASPLFQHPAILRQVATEERDYQTALIARLQRESERLETPEAPFEATLALAVEVEAALGALLGQLGSAPASSVAAPVSAATDDFLDDITALLGEQEAPR